jgi:hypothetical protein
MIAESHRPTGRIRLFSSPKALALSWSKSHAGSSRRNPGLKSTGV